jgi:hypothetical protein
MTGGFQPDKLAKCFGKMEDGLYGRMLFGWPLEPEYKKLKQYGNEFDPEFVNALSRINGLVAEDVNETFTPIDVPLSPDALQCFEKFRESIFNGRHFLEGRERETWGKAPTMILRLAGTLSFMNWAMADPKPSAHGIVFDEGQPGQIGAEFIERAINLWKSYFWPHNRAALRLIDGKVGHAEARRILRWTRVKGADPTWPRELSVNIVRKHALALSVDAEEAMGLLDDLTSRGWLQPRMEPPKGGIGKPLRRWSINPLLWSVDAEFDPDD